MVNSLALIWRNIQTLARTKLSTVTAEMYKDNKGPGIIGINRIKTQFTVCPCSNWWFVTAAKLGNCSGNQDTTVCKTFLTFKTNINRHISFCGGGESGNHLLKLSVRTQENLGDVCHGGRHPLQHAPDLRVKSCLWGASLPGVGVNHEQRSPQSLQLSPVPAQSPWSRDVVNSTRVIFIFLFLLPKLALFSTDQTLVCCMFACFHLLSGYTKVSMFPRSHSRAAPTRSPPTPPTTH